LSIGIRGIEPVRVQRSVSAMISLTPTAPDFDFVRERKATTTTRDAANSTTRREDGSGLAPITNPKVFFHVFTGRLLCRFRQ